MSALLFLAAAEAAQVTIGVATDDLHEGQSVGLQVAVVDAQPKGLPRLAAPGGLTLAYRSQSQSSLLMNFQMSSTVTFHYVLTALAEGTYTLPPAIVDTAQGELRSAPLVLKVGPREDGGVNELTGGLAREEAWLGELLLYRATFSTDQKGVQPNWRLPEPDGLTAEPGLEPIVSETAILQDGEPRTQLSLLWPLRVDKLGTLSVPGAILQAQFPVKRERPTRRDRFGGLFEELGAFADYAQQVYTAPTGKLVVRALPEQGRPPGFDGLVGNVSIRATASTPRVNVGETVTLTTVVEADTPLGAVRLPPLELPGVRSYDDQPVATAQLTADGVRATSTLKRALVPSTPGRIEVPAIEVPYFDPRLGAYRVARTEPLVLEVGGTAGAASVASFATEAPATEVEALAEDILPIRANASISAPWPAWTTLLPLFPGAALLLAQLAPKLRRGPKVAERRYEFADLPAAPEARLAGLERIFRERVAARLGTTPEAVHREDLPRLGEDAEAAEAIYRTLERMRYGGAQSDLPEQALAALVQKWS